MCHVLRKVHAKNEVVSIIIEGAMAKKVIRRLFKMAARGNDLGSPNSNLIDGSSPNYMCESVVGVS